MTEEERIESIYEKGGRHLQTFKPENVTYEMCKIAVADDGSAMAFVPDEFKTEELFKIGCGNDAELLGSVPKELMSRELCDIAVSNSAVALKHVPLDMRDEELCLKAVVNHNYMYRYVPDQILTESFCLKVIEASGYASISSWPKKFKNAGFYERIVEKDPQILKYLPMTSHSAKLCRIAISRMGYDKISDAVKAHPELMGDLHSSLYDYETVLSFVKSDYCSHA